MAINQEIGEAIQLLMIRRTDESEMFGYRIVDLPLLYIGRESFKSPSKLLPSIAIFRKRVGKTEHFKYRKALAD